MPPGTGYPNRVSKAFSDGAERMRKALGGEADMELVFYNTLRPGDFRAIMEEHGFDQLQLYIQTMENKRGQR